MIPASFVKDSIVLGLAESEADMAPIKKIDYGSKPGLLNITVACSGGIETKAHDHVLKDVIEQQFDAWQEGKLAQEAFPDMPRDEREVLISGTCPKCWKEIFG